MESRFPAMLVLCLGREFYRGKYGMTESRQDWTPDLGDHFGDKSMIPVNATLFSISLLGKKICLNIRENSMRRHGLSGRVYKGRSWIREQCVLIHWNDFGVSSAVRARKAVSLALLKALLLSLLVIC
ncbi:hypothetical protein AVEN_26794-1 [Araneus ventricosus]|uniref:Uncharacterized protein n=1 Tax=Araneus ventricosus TaxID=182803 RepID=A0A4Y2F8K2_ARAVE|nr:hypothetical protein AVEN_26794-1 [Araneus ventricosus]